MFAKKKPEPERWTRQELGKRLDALIANARGAGLQPSDIAEQLNRRLEAMRSVHNTTAPIDRRFF